VGEGVAAGGIFGESVAVGDWVGNSLEAEVAVGGFGVAAAPAWTEVPQAASKRTNKGKIRMVFIE
jgi:hypothetical protein